MLENPTVDQVINLWTEALESGRFIQGQKYLCGIKDGSQQHCCLGVLCELAIENGVKINKVPSGYGYMQYGNEVSMLPNEIKEWAKMKHIGGEYFADNVEFLGVRGAKRNYLWADNDTGKSFKDIAKIIRENKAELFITQSP